MIVPLQNNFTKNQFRDHNRNLWRAFLGGTSDNSFDEETQTGITVGYSITDDEEMKPEIEKYVTIPGYEDVEAGIVKWPLSVLRIRHKDEKRLIDLATHVLEVWRGYTDEAAFIFAETDGEPHNTITPIARKKGDMYELDLTLRNNITTEENPLGVYHPHAQYHHIKKENIGLIEVMGLAVTPCATKRRTGAFGRIYSGWQGCCF